MWVFHGGWNRTRRDMASTGGRIRRIGSSRTLARRTVAALFVAATWASVTACAAPTTSPGASTATAGAPTTTPTTVPTTTPAAPGSGTKRDPPAPAAFVALSDVDPTILQDIRYHTDHNFVGRPIAGYDEPLCILTRQAADRLHRVQTAARAHGYSLKVYDCYRPQRAVDDFVRWGKRFDDQKMKAEFYPHLDKSVLFKRGYIAGPTAHSRGSTVDLTLVAIPGLRG